MDAAEQMKNLANGKKYKFKIIYEESCYDLENKLNKLAEEINIVDVSIAGGHGDLYCIIKYIE